MTTDRDEPTGTRPHNNWAKLSGREKEVLNHLCAGRSIKDIAGAMAIAERTVRQHLKSCRQHFGVGSSLALVSAAMREQLAGVGGDDGNLDRQVRSPTYRQGETLPAAAG